jgi:hypothetical protein
LGYIGYGHESAPSLLALQSSAMHREPVRAILHAIFVIDYQSFNHHHVTY